MDDSVTDSTRDDKPDHGPALPALMPGATYRGPEFRENLGIGRDTFRRMKEAGLKVYDLGVKGGVVRSVDFDRFIEEHGDEFDALLKQERIQRNRQRTKKG